MASFANLLCGLPHASAGEIANCFGAVPIALPYDHSIEFVRQVIVERDCDALQFLVPSVCASMTND